MSSYIQVKNQLRKKALEEALKANIRRRKTQKLERLTHTEICQHQEKKKEEPHVYSS